MSLHSVMELLDKVSDELNYCKRYDEANRLKSLKKQIGYINESNIDDKTKKELLNVIGACSACKGYFDIGGGTYNMPTWAELLRSLASEIVSTFGIRKHGKNRNIRYFWPKT